MKSKPNPAVDFYFQKAEAWHKEFKKLRNIALDCGLAEELKWGCACYVLPSTVAEKGSPARNVILIHGFKEYCALLFFKGALLKDAHGLLIQQTANVQAARQIRFKDADEIAEQQPMIVDYIRQAMAVEQAGLKVQLKKTAEYEVPAEFQLRLDKARALKTAFAALTPGRQRAYLHYFSQPKQATTRSARVEKCIPMILAGKGLND